MSDQTPAQEEFASFLAKNSSTKYSSHPEDRDDYHDSKAFHSDGQADSEDEDEEDRFRNAQIEAAMRMPTMDSRTEIRLPPAGFDAGAATGVKGVIADARAYENAKRSAKWKNRVRSARRSVFGGGGDASPEQQKSGSRKYSDGAGSSGLDSDFGSDAGLDSMDEDEKEFLERWRESRRRELEKSSMNPASRQRRTSPSSRQFGRLDNVDAIGYLDAIEKVGPETAVVVFVYDHECPVSAAIEIALRPIVHSHPAIHFVKVHYAEMEFDNAAVPSILAYRNQGDLFANLTGLIEMIPDDEDFDSDTLKRLFERYGILRSQRGEPAGW
ncbi:putative phosducin [Neurospora crassa]|nr:putative phosducin [Neurospora crassa]